MIRYFRIPFKKGAFNLDGIEGESYVVNSDGSYSMYSIGSSGFGKYDWGRFLIQNEGMASLGAYDCRYDLVLPTNLTMTVEDIRTYKIEECLKIQQAALDRYNAR